MFLSFAVGGGIGWYSTHEFLWWGVLCVVGIIGTVVYACVYGVIGAFLEGLGYIFDGFS